MSIIIGADLVPTQNNKDAFSTCSVEKIIDSDLYEKILKADFRIFNLEAPLTDVVSPIKKCGPALSVPTACANGFSQMNIDLFALANNHVMDQGVDGLKSTLAVLDKFNISYVGVGENINDVKRSYTLDCCDKKIGIYVCAEHEFSIATLESAGVNPFDPLESLDHIRELKGHCDYVVVLYHGGREHYRYPSPELQRVCRKMVEKGADLVICQHSHCIGCEECYLNGRIVYGQGNFLFDLSNNECWKTGLLISIDHNFKLEYIPVVKDAEKVRMASLEEAKSIMADFAKRSDKILKDSFVRDRYESYCSSKINQYLLSFTDIGDNLVFRVLNKLSGYRLGNYWVKKKYLPKKREFLINMLECEAHRELILQGMKNNLK